MQLSGEFHAGMMESMHMISGLWHAWPHSLFLSAEYQWRLLCYDEQGHQQVIPVRSAGVTLIEPPFVISLGGSRYVYTYMCSKYFKGHQFDDT